MYVSSTTSYLVRIVIIFLCVIYWNSSDANQQNLTEKNDSYKLFTHYRRDVSSSKNKSQPIFEKRQIAKFEISTARFSKAGSSEITGNGSGINALRSKRETSSLLTIATFGGAASATSWFAPRRRLTRRSLTRLTVSPPIKNYWVIVAYSTNLNIIVNCNNALTALTDKKLGRVVINGVPKWNIATAVYVMNVRRIITYGIWAYEFVHPPTGVKIKVPDMGDDYVVARKAFKIFVDNRGTTYMLFKGLDRTEGQMTFGGTGRNALNPSIRGYPKYDVSKAVVIENTVQLFVKGNVVIEFDHPVTRERNRVSNNVGDTYVNRVTKKVYLIYVDKRGKTYLIRKNTVQKLGPSVGNIVVNGRPKFNLVRATYVMDSVQKYDLRGSPVIEFVNPFTKQMIEMPVTGGQVCRDKHNNVYIIFVDAGGRTLLVFQYRNDKCKVMQEKIVATVVYKRHPKHDIASAIMVEDTVRRVREDKSHIIEFLHPLTKQLTIIHPYFGDVYLDQQTRRTYLIVVDRKGRTLLIFRGWMTKAITTSQRVVYSVGTAVVKGIPKYNVLRNVIIVRDTVQTTGGYGCPVVQFVYPRTRQKIQIPLNKGDEYTMKKTGEVFKIFVDICGTTYLILRSRYRGKNGEALIHGMQIVIRGVPKYNALKATFVENTEKTFGKNRKLVIVFVHPATRRKVELPYDVGDVYVRPGTKRVYKICVTKEGRTLMIFMGPRGEKKQHWVTVVKKGLPKYVISKAIVITKVAVKREINGFVMRELVEFRHPITRVMVTVSIAGADTYIEPGTRRVFIICVDNRDRSLLIFLGMTNQFTYSRRPSISSISIIDNIVTKPKIPYITKVEKKMGPNGVWFIKFVHPDTKKTIRVPFEGADEYVEWKTGRVFIIFVDRRKKTLLVFKSYLKDLATNNNIHRDTSWGSIVVDGKPNCDISKATYVMETEKKWLPSGVWIIEFIHPDTKETIRVPFEGADEYVERKTGRVFIICVDHRKKALLVLKKENSTVDSMNGDNTRNRTLWGSIVIDGKPKYDISQATYVMETEKKWLPSGVWIIEFIHPDTKEIIRVPFEGADEYVERKTGRVFIICVDRRTKTLLVLKKENSTVDSMNGDNTGNRTLWGSIVIDGKPKYDISQATYVMETEKKWLPSGVWIIEFIHPDTKEIIRVPFEGADEYVERKTGRVFIICVDRRTKTLLVLKKENSTVDSMNGDNTRNRTLWGSIVIDGKPKYDISQATYVMETEKKWLPSGVWIIEFIHPDTKETIRVPFEGADEYVERKTGRVFIICVDRRKKTLLVLKKENPKDGSEDRDNTHHRTLWGSIVIDGKPQYNISNATYITKTKKERTLNGVWIIEFVHPDTKETIRVPFKEGDKYIETKTKRVFIICVDRRGKTLLVFKGPDNINSSTVRPTLVGSESEGDDSSVSNTNYNVNTNINENIVSQNGK